MAKGFGKYLLEFPGLQIDTAVDLGIGGRRPQRRNGRHRGRRTSTGFLFVRRFTFSIRFNCVKVWFGQKTNVSASVNTGEDSPGMHRERRTTSSGFFVCLFVDVLVYVSTVCQKCRLVRKTNVSDSVIQARSSSTTVYIYGPIRCPFYCFFYSAECWAVA